MRHSSACCHWSACAQPFARDLRGSWPDISGKEFKKSTRALPDDVWIQLSCFCYRQLRWWSSILKEIYLLYGPLTLKAGSKVSMMITSVVYSCVQTW